MRDESVHTEAARRLGDACHPVCSRHVRRGRGCKAYSVVLRMAVSISSGISGYDDGEEEKYRLLSKMGSHLRHSGHRFPAYFGLAGAAARFSRAAAVSALSHQSLLCEKKQRQGAFK